MLRNRKREYNFKSRNEIANNVAQKCSVLFTDKVRRSDIVR